MNTKQLTYPTIEEQTQYWINKEAQSNNATNETREAQRLAEAIREAIRLEDETIILEALAEYDASNLSKPASTTADPKLEDIGGNELPDRIKANKDFYEVERNDFDRGDLRDEGRNPDGSGESYAERNV